MRKSSINRKTLETDICLALNVDGGGVSKISTGIGFFDHMLEILAKHSGMTIDLTCKGDTRVDSHHTVEDIGIVLGSALAKALGDRRGIARYSNVSLPMDESLVDVSMDISNRPFLVYNGELFGSCGEYDNEMTEEFLRAFVNNAGITLHINVRYGKNQHHIIEAIFKGLAKCIQTAVKVVGNEIPSSKGIL